MKPNGKTLHPYYLIKPDIRRQISDIRCQMSDIRQRIKNKKGRLFVKRIIATICCFALLSFGLNCFALTCDEAKANLITNQGKTGIVKEYATVTGALENAKSGDTVELIGDSKLQNEITVDKNITLLSGEKRKSNIIIGKNAEISETDPIKLDNVKLKNNGEKYLITFKNIYVNGDLVTETGDINADNTVDLRDLIGIKKSLAKTEDYAVKTDLNLDTFVNAKDIVILTDILLNKYL